VNTTFSGKMIALAFTCVFLFMSNPLLAQANSEGFDLIESKIDGRVTVAGRAARFCLSGKTAEAIYYQLSGQNFVGLSCGIFQSSPDKPATYQCAIDISLKKGKLNDYADQGACDESQGESDLERNRAYFNSKENKFPRSKDLQDREDLIEDKNIDGE